ncbi:MAG: hypothetical protein IJU20_02960 [Clostridia bacterium]|nr:hypothetical protein [Clostridia bacterium]
MNHTDGAVGSAAPFCKESGRKKGDGMEENQFVVGYRCPQCGAGVLSPVDFTKIGADMVRLKCDCGRSSMQISKKNASEVMVEAPCLLCHKIHARVLPVALLTQRDFFSYSCPYSDMPVFYAGEINHVKAEMAKSELELLNAMEESEGGSPLTGSPDGDKDRDLSWQDPQRVQDILYVLRELDEEGRIFCRCDPVRGRSYDVDLCPEGVRVSCPRCGCRRTIPADSSLKSQLFLEATELDLKVRD